jgi:transcriptional regulator with XRE-family HTH domain
LTARTPKQPSASEVVREAIGAAGLRIRELARRTGVEPSALSRFMSGQVGISLTTFEKLAPELGLRIVREAPARPAEPVAAPEEGAGPTRPTSRQSRGAKTGARFSPGSKKG